MKNKKTRNFLYYRTARGLFSYEKGQYWRLGKNRFYRCSSKEFEQVSECSWVYLGCERGRTPGEAWNKA